MVGFNFAPVGWAICDGSLLSISDYDVLFNVIGTTYGGNGTTNFALPDLRGRIPIHMGEGAGLPAFVIGEQGGEETHTLAAAEMPGHTHHLYGVSNPATSNAPADTYMAQASGALGLAYGPAASLAQMSASALSHVGGSQPHSNIQPYLTVTFIIALEGVYPSQG